MFFYVTFYFIVFIGAFFVFSLVSVESKHCKNLELVLEARFN